jgi:predicted ATPase/class 3 adenylate cyclase
VSSTLQELEAERRAVRAAVESLRLTPVMFELGARPYPPRELYRAYLDQSDLFVGVYGASYGWVAPDMDISGLEDEYWLAEGLPRLVYIRKGEDSIDPRLESLLANIALDGVSFRPFSTPEELGELVRDDLAVLLTERFELSAAQRSGVEDRAESAAHRLVSLLFADVEGSDRLWEAHPEAIAEHERSLRAIARTHGGRVFSTGDDCFAAVFPSVRSAAEAAVAAQSAARSLEVDGEPLLLRMAVHSGEVEERDHGFFGPALNRCGRLREAAHGGQVLVSAAAAALLSDPLPDRISLLDLGEHRLRDLSRPRRVFQLCHPELPDEFPTLRSLGGFSSNLPVQVTSFIGRAGESAELADAIRDSRLVTDVGAGGCGKTRLAIQVAAGMSTEFPDGVCLIELAPLSDPELVESAVGAALGLQQQPGSGMLDALAGFLRSRELLLLVDNCEHVVEAAADLVGHLLSATPSIRVLATSREPLRVRGEAIYQLRPLAVPERGADWEGLAGSDGVRLFADRAASANPGFRLSPDNAAAVAGVCTRLDGIPLALELAASTTRFLTPEQIEVRLDDRFRLLTGGARDDFDHHRTLEAAIEWSYGLLDPEHQRLFEALSVFAGPFDIEAAEAVCRPAAGPDVLGGVGLLADRSLLEFEEAVSGVRYRMLESIRAFAAERLERQPDDLGERLRWGHCRHFLTLAGKVTEGPISADAPPAWLAELDAVTPDLHRALAWATGGRRDQCAVDLAGSLGWYWHLRRRGVEATHWLQSIPIDSPDVTLRSRVRALRFAALHLTNIISGGADDFPRARDAARRSLELARQAGDPELTAACLHQVGIIGVLGGDPDAAGVLEEGMAIAGEAGDEWRQVLIRNMLAHHYHHAGRLEGDAAAIERARALWEENLREARRLGDDRTTAMTLGFLCHIVRTHDPGEARRLAEESLEIGRRLDDHGALNNALSYVGDAAYLMGDLEAARAAERELAELTWRTLGEEDEMVYLALGVIDYAEHDHASARANFGRALELMDPSPASVWGALNLRRVLWGLGRVLAREGALRESAVLFAAVESADHAHPPWIDEVREPADYRECIRLIEEGLGSDGREAAYRWGEALSLEQAVEFALGVLGAGDARHGAAGA